VDLHEFTNSMHDGASISDQRLMNLQAVMDSFIEETSVSYVFDTDAYAQLETFLWTAQS
jgi:hypothetical protein